MLLQSVGAHVRNQSRNGHGGRGPFGPAGGPDQWRLVGFRVVGEGGDPTQGKQSEIERRRSGRDRTAPVRSDEIGIRNRNPNSDDRPRRQSFSRGVRFRTIRDWDDLLTRAMCVRGIPRHGNGPASGRRRQRAPPWADPPISLPGPRSAARRCSTYGVCRSRHRDRLPARLNRPSPDGRRRRARSRARVVPPRRPASPAMRR